MKVTDDQAKQDLLKLQRNSKSNKNICLWRRHGQVIPYQVPKTEWATCGLYFQMTMIMYSACFWEVKQKSSIKWEAPSGKKFLH